MLKIVYRVLLTMHDFQKSIRVLSLLVQAFERPLKLRAHPPSKTIGFDVNKNSLHIFLNFPRG